MAHGADFNKQTESLTLKSGGSALVGMRLNRDDVSTLRVVVQDVGTGGVLTESKAIPVSLKS